jgi:2-methylisocitrate lyase-like PEP mutase family enzyme
MDKYQLLKKLLSGDETLVVPDAYDAISAKLIQYCGFHAVQCSGYSFSLSKAYKSETALTLEENIATTGEIVKAVDVPVMADGEDGYGTGDDFEKNVISFIKTGIAGINIEDQNLWNPRDPQKIIAAELMAKKIKTVLKIKTDLSLPDFILNARTDALHSLPDRKAALNLAIERANAYLALGADICFVTQVKTKEELKLLKREINGPLSIAAGLPYNLAEFSITDCRELGVARVSLPSLLVSASIQSILAVLREVKNENSLDAKKLIDSAVLAELLK